MENKILTIAIIGMGARGGYAYGTYLVDNPQKFKIVAICDPDEYRLNKWGDYMSVPKEKRFLSEDEFFKDSFYIFRLNEPESIQETPPFRFKKLLPDDFVVKRKNTGTPIKPENSGIYVVKKNLLTEMLTEKNLMMALEILKILLLILILIIK